MERVNWIDRYENNEGGTAYATLRRKGAGGWLAWLTGHGAARLLLVLEGMVDAGVGVDVLAVAVLHGLLVQLLRDGALEREAVVLLWGWVGDVVGCG